MSDLEEALARGKLNDMTVGDVRIEEAPGLDAVNVTFGGTSFRQAKLAGARFADCTFLACTFRSADLTDCRFESCRFFDSASDAKCDFSYADLRRSRFERCDLTTAKLSQTRTFGLELVACQASGAAFDKADFGLGTGAFYSATFDGCNLAYADFSSVNLTECTLTGCRLTHAIFDDAVLERADLSGSALENIEGRGLVLIGADLRGATFNNLNPRDMDLTGVRVDAEQGMLLLLAMGIEVG
jgi:fluoroquinolone resistance protein